MRYLHTGLILLCLILLISIATAGEDDKDPRLPKQLIVKIKAEHNLALTGSREGIALTGLSSIDTLNNRRGVNSQQSLFTPETRNAHPPTLQNVLLVEVPAGVDLYELIEEYKNLEEVEYVEPNWPIELFENPNDPLYDHQWYLHNTGQGCYHVLRREGDYNDTLILQYGVADADIDALEVFENPPDNTRTVIIGLIDTGVDMDHPDLVDRIWINVDEIPQNGLDDDHNGYIDDYKGWNYYTNQPGDDPIDVMGHGTHCAGILAAVTNNSVGIAGINTDCKLMVI